MSYTGESSNAANAVQVPDQDASSQTPEQQLGKVYDACSGDSDGLTEVLPAEQRIGRVMSVAGAQVVVLLDITGPQEALQQAPDLQIGALVKMRNTLATVYGMVSGLSIPIPSMSDSAPEMKIVQVELVGESAHGAGEEPGPFHRGVSYCPALGDAVFLSDQQDLRHVFAQPSDHSVQIGTIYQDKSLPAFVSVDDLLGKHFAVLGTTGSGKSCAVARILNAILSANSNSHAILLDLHNEYSHAFSGMAETLGPGTLDLPFWMLNYEELKHIVIGSDLENREADTIILREAVIESKRAFQGGGPGSHLISADTPVPYRLSDVSRLIDKALGKLDKATDSAPYLRLQERLAAVSNDKRLAFLFNQGLAVRDNMTAILSRIFRVPVNNKPITILDLSGVPSEVLNVVISLICRLTFDFAIWCDRALPILLVCEEAHRYMAQEVNTRFDSSKAVLNRIAKEGRKYGVSLCVVSQRPSDLSPGILSQCNTIFAMRMSNQKDHEFVRGTLSESTVGLLDSLPTLRTGEAIAVGEGVAVPARMLFDEMPPEKRPKSGTAPFSTAWQVDDKDESFVASVVKRWRNNIR